VVKEIFEALLALVVEDGIVHPDVFADFDCDEEVKDLGLALY
jgi:hypothetical protein